MSDFWRTKKVTTRKTHQCLGCLESFPTGSVLEYNAGKWNGDMQAYYLCGPCRAYIDSDDSISDTLRDEGFAGGDIKEWRKEAEQEKDKEAARAASR